MGALYESARAMRLRYVNAPGHRLIGVARDIRAAVVECKSTPTRFIKTRVSLEGRTLPTKSARGTFVRALDAHFDERRFGWRSREGQHAFAMAATGTGRAPMRRLALPAIDLQHRVRRQVLCRRCSARVDDDGEFPEVLPERLRRHPHCDARPGRAPRGRMSQTLHRVRLKARNFRCVRPARCRGSRRLRVGE